MCPAATPPSASRGEASAPRFAFLGRWGFTKGGWRDNRHGEWWLLAQLALITLLLAPPLPPPARLGVPWPWPARLAGVALLVLGLVGALRALLRLGPNLSPLPEPMPQAALVITGPYARCRHPLYQAILLGALGIALLLGSLLHLLIGLALATVLAGKARREERGLLRLHPAYAAYQRETAAILPHIPGLDWRA